MSVWVGAIVMHVSDIDRAAAFWGPVLGYVPDPDQPHFLIPATGQGPRIHLDTGDQNHLDLWVDRQDSDQAAEVDRLVALGARRVDWVYPEGADFVVLADPDGNLFCVIA
jgi:catechol 2,3-dioxygenase-like lactoylglutathione lyase family enzyme